MPALRTDDGARITYRDEGDGLPVVLLHGFPFTSALWGPQVEALRDGYRVILPDFRGFGGSEVPPGPYAMSRHAGDVEAIVAELDLERIVLGGLSMGGYVAFAYYRRYPDRVRALILADTRAEPDSEESKANRETTAETALSRGTPAVVEPMLPKLLAPGTRRDRPDVEDELREMMEAADPRAVAAALRGMAQRADSRPLLSEIGVPVLVVVGAEDAITPPEGARDMAGRIPGARVRVIPDAGHVSNLEQPEEFNRAMLEFLDRIANQEGP